MRIRVYDTGNEIRGYQFRWSIGPDDDPDANSPRDGLYGGTQSLNEYMGGYAATEDEAVVAAKATWERRRPVRDENLS